MKHRRQYVPLLKKLRVDRNGLCLCGSMKKFKNCCLPEIEAIEQQSIIHDRGIADSVFEKYNVKVGTKLAIEGSVVSQVISEDEVLVMHEDGSQEPMSITDVLTKLK